MKLLKPHLLFLFIIIIFSCSSNIDEEEEVIDYDALNETGILNYLSENKLTATKSNLGLFAIIKNEGSGSSPNDNSKVTVIYKGYFLNNEVFNETDNSGVTFDFAKDKFIPGFIEAVLALKLNGEGIFILPSRLAYGELGNPFSSTPIPPWAVIVFDIKLINIE